MGRIVHSRWVHFFLLSFLVTMAAVYSFSEVRWRREMQYLVFDGFNSFYPREKQGEVIIVNLDDDSLKKIGQWPWPRTVIAEMITNLTEMGARAVVFDGVLAEPDRSSPRYILEKLPAGEEFAPLRAQIEGFGDHDEILGLAIQKSGIFVAGFTHSTYSQTPQTPKISKEILVSEKNKEIFLKNAQRFRQAATFLPILENAAAGNGSFMATPDPDGVLRTTSMIFSDGKALYPSLSLEAVRILSADPKLAIKLGRNPDYSPNTISTQYSIVIGDYTVPVEKDGILWIYYRVFDERSDDYLSAYKVLSPEHHDFVKSQVKDKVVFLGSSAEGLKDLRSTALEPFQPGVEIHANVVEQILQKKFLLRPNITYFAEANFILIVGMVVVFLVPFIHVFLLACVTFGLMALAFFGAIVGYAEHGILFDPFYPSLCVFLIFVMSTFLNYLRAEYERLKVRDAFGLYISPDFMTELTRDPGKLKLGGEIRDLSIMFTDIRNFTSISEDMNPEELIQMMNDFLTPMSDLVMQTKGTIDKYIGDAMMAFWNAPLDDPDHAYHACMAALKMQAALEPINTHMAMHAQEKGKSSISLRVGIGINTGACAVGNMGSRQRFAYSALGDAVNVASRLEGQTKIYGTDILIGEPTWKQVQEMAWLEVDLLQLHGKTEPMRVFTLLGDKDKAENLKFQTLREHHEKMIASYRAGNFTKAKEYLEKCRADKCKELEKLYSLYEHRTTDLIQTSPKDWNGVYVAKGK